jgi:hypothetical protein
MTKMYLPSILTRDHAMVFRRLWLDIEKLFPIFVFLVGELNFIVVV